MIDLLPTHNLHLLEQISRSGVFVYHPKSKSDVECDVATKTAVVHHIAHGAFPVAIKIGAYQLAFGIYYRTAAVATGGVIAANKGGAE